MGEVEAQVIVACVAASPSSEEEVVVRPAEEVHHLPLLKVRMAGGMTLRSGCHRLGAEVAPMSLAIAAILDRTGMKSSRVQAEQVALVRHTHTDLRQQVAAGTADFLEGAAEEVALA